jgi:hypothetical protein
VMQSLFERIIRQIVVTSMVIAMAGGEGASLSIPTRSPIMRFSV